MRLAHDAVEQMASQPDSPEIDPASQLFFEFAAPLLLTAETEEQFKVASTLAEFVWTTTHFDAHAQVAIINQFIEESGVSDDQIPWFLDIYTELAERKAALLGQ